MYNISMDPTPSRLFHYDYHSLLSLTHHLESLHQTKVHSGLGLRAKNPVVNRKGSETEVLRVANENSRKPL